jgi:hypothetical protein
MMLDARFWRDRAAETRRLTDNTSAVEAQILTEIAGHYERLAELADAASTKKDAAAEPALE